VEVAQGDYEVRGAIFSEDGILMSLRGGRSSQRSNPLSFGDCFGRKSIALAMT